MKIKLFVIISLFCIKAFSLAPLSEPNLVIQNSILARVNNQNISVVDVVKKMDVFLDKYYPEALSSNAAKYQFYSANWKAVLSQMIDTELILANAAEKEITTTDAEVRKSIQERFGPNVMASLDRIGISYEEAKKIISSEITVQKMNWFNVNSKVIQKVGPEQIKQAYEKYCQENLPSTKWNYVVISVNTPNEEKSKEAADIIYTSLNDSECSLENLETYLKNNPHNFDFSEIQVSISKDYDLSDKDISKNHKAVLENLKEGLFSTPVCQKNRTNNNLSHKIFFLKKSTKTNPKSFQEIAHELEKKLFDEASEKETIVYIEKLRNRFGYQKSKIETTLPENFNPFALN